MNWKKKKWESGYSHPGVDYTLQAKESPDGKKHSVKIRYNTYSMEYEVNIDGRQTEHKYKTMKEAMKKASHLRKLVTWQITQKSRRIRPFGGAVSVAIATGKTLTAFNKFGSLCKGLPRDAILQIRLSKAGLRFRIHTVGQIGYIVPARELAFIRSRGVHSFEIGAKEFGTGLSWMTSASSKMLIFQTGPTGSLHLANYNLGLPQEYEKPLKGKQVRKSIKVPRIGNQKTTAFARLNPMRMKPIARTSKLYMKSVADSFTGKKIAGPIRLYTVPAKKKKKGAKVTPKPSILVIGAKVEMTVPAAHVRRGKARMGVGHIPALKAFLKMQHGKGNVSLGTRKGRAVFVAQPSLIWTKSKQVHSKTIAYFIA